VKRSKLLPKEEALRWGISPDEELEIDKAVFARTVELMPQKMGLSFDELIEQEIRGGQQDQEPADKPGISFEELAAKVEPFMQPEVKNMPVFYWLFSSLFFNGWAEQALKDEPDIAKDVRKFTTIYSRELSKEFRNRELTPNYFAILPYFFVPKDQRPRLLRLPEEKKANTLTLPTAQLTTHIYGHVASKAEMTTKDIKIWQGKRVLNLRAKSYIDTSASLAKPPAEVLERMHKSLLQIKQYGAALLKTQLDLMSEAYNAGGELPTFHYNFADALERQGYKRQSHGAYDPPTMDGLRRRVVALAHQSIEVLELSSKKNNNRYIEATPYWVIETTRRLTAGEEYNHSTLLLEDPTAPIFTGFTLRPGLWWPMIDMGRYRLEIPASILELPTDGNGNEVERLALQLTPALANWERSSQNLHAGKDRPYSIGALLEAAGYTTRNEFLKAHGEAAKRIREYLASTDGTSGAIPLLNKLGAFNIDIKDEAEFYASGRGWREKFWNAQIRLSVRDLRLPKKVRR
jgi:hypothetical protein